MIGNARDKKNVIFAKNCAFSPSHFLSHTLSISISIVLLGLTHTLYSKHISILSAQAK